MNLFCVCFFSSFRSVSPRLHTSIYLSITRLLGAKPVKPVERIVIAFSQSESVYFRFTKKFQIWNNRNWVYCACINIRSNNNKKTEIIWTAVLGIDDWLCDAQKHTYTHTPIRQYTKQTKWFFQKVDPRKINEQIGFFSFSLAHHPATTVFPFKNSSRIYKFIANLKFFFFSFKLSYVVLLVSIRWW